MLVEALELVMVTELGDPSVSWAISFLSIANHLSPSFPCPFIKSVGIPFKLTTTMGFEVWGKCLYF